MKRLVIVLVAMMLVHHITGDSNTELVAKASNTFSNKLYQKLAAQPGNLVVCPLSLHVALGLVLQGAGGNTASQLSTAMGFSSANQDTKQSYKSLLTGISDNTLKIATKLFPAAGYELNKNYVDLARQYFLSDVEGVDFSKPAAAANTINKYVEEHTNNKIHDLISPDSLSDLTKLVIVNAVHFQANWKHKFSDSYSAPFKVSPQETVQTKMMTQTNYFDYKEDAALDAKLLKMNYENVDYSMLFILPNKEDGLQSLETKLVNADLSSLLKDMRNTKVEVTIPKFKVEQTHKLTETISSMGVTDLFTGRANLRGITNNGDNLYVSDIVQKTFINVHENGTEAAAATGIYLELLSANFDTKYFIARWPFYFALIHNEEPRTIVFKGRLVRTEHYEEYDYPSSK